MDNATDNPNAKRNKLLLPLWTAIFCMTVLSLFTTINIARLRSRSLPFETIPLEGKVVILDESGMPVPHQPAIVTFFSHYPPDGVDRPCNQRRKEILVDESGNFKIVMPKYSATLFAHTNNDKYVAVVHVDVEPELSPIELTVELHPRYSATGRLVGGVNPNPQKIRLRCTQKSDYSKKDFSGGRSAIVETFHSVEIETDSTGLFTVEDLIPGTEYSIIVRNRPEAQFQSYQAGILNVPVLTEEEYAQPYSFGDIIVSAAPVYK